jgi:hypothetical protein
MGSLDYFDKVKHDGNTAEGLYKKYQESTKGLDQEVAFEALEGGRVFGDSDRARYDTLMANRGKAKEKAQAQQASPSVTNNQSPNQNQKSNTDSSQSQDVRQDNDINTNINGDNNLVNNSQDNSIRQYGGNTKVFNYQGGKGGMDTPVSAGTMGGMFHDEDSPAKSAAFLDRYMTQNRDFQKQFENRGHAEKSIRAADRNQTINIDNIDQRLAERTKASRARSEVMSANIFGDMYNFTPNDFKGAEAQDPVESPNFKKLGKI